MVSCGPSWLSVGSSSPDWLLLEGVAETGGFPAAPLRFGYAVAFLCGCVPRVESTLADHPVLQEHIFYY